MFYQISIIFYKDRNMFKHLAVSKLFYYEGIFKPESLTAPFLFHMNYK